MQLAIDRPELGRPNGVAQYIRLSSLIRHRITDGQWKVGDRLPTVVELAATLGVARVTVRHAYSILCREGLISSRRGRGTYVEATPSDGAGGIRPADESMNGRDIRFTILSRDLRMNLPADLAGDNKVRDEYVRIRKIHLHDGEPFCLAAIYLSADIYRRMPRRSEDRVKLASVMARMSGLSLGSMHQVMTVVPADESIARHLNYRIGAPMAHIQRRILDDQGFVAYAGHFWYRGDRFVTEIEMPFEMYLRYPGAAQPESKPLRRA